MSRDIDEIRRRLFTGSRVDTIFQAVVTAVDEKEFTCEVKRNDSVTYSDVRLRGLIDPGLKGVSMIPQVQSVVLVARIGESNELFVCQFTEIGKIFLESGDISFTLNKDKITLKKGENISLSIDDEGFRFKSGETIVKALQGGITLSRGNSGIKKTLNDLLTAIQKLTVTTGVGPSGPPINISDFMKIQTDLSNYLEE